MEKTVIVRPTDKLGRVVLPIELRRMMGFAGGTAVRILVDTAKDAIIIRRRDNACSYCGNAKNLKAFRGKHICPTCQRAIEKL